MDEGACVAAAGRLGLAAAGKRWLVVVQDMPVWKRPLWGGVDCFELGALRKNSYI